MRYTINIGFTGSRNGFTLKQVQIFSAILQEILKSNQYTHYDFHHGCCKGADLEAAEIFRKILPEGNIVQYPPTNMNFATINEADKVLPPKPFLERNHDIVDACSFMIAVSSTRKEQQRSGTWATIRYAKKQNKLVEIIFP